VLYEAAGDKKLMKTISMDFIRKQFKVDTGKSISCISSDIGVIHHNNGSSVPIRELEVEWYYGDEGDFIELANLIRSKYGLEFEERSKLQRAFE
jgi:inorganic triphosphatase YgiF